MASCRGSKSKGGKSLEPCSRKENLVNRETIIDRPLESERLCPFSLPAAPCISWAGVGSIIIQFRLSRHLPAALRSLLSAERPRSPSLGHWLCRFHHKRCCLAPGSVVCELFMEVLRGRLVVIELRRRWWLWKEIRGNRTPMTRTVTEARGTPRISCGEL